MARPVMVTRTVETTTVTALCLDTVSCEPCNKETTLAGVFKSEEKMLKEVKKALEKDGIAVAKIVDVKVNENLYGMSLEKFVQNAEILPPRAGEKEAE